MTAALSGMYTIDVPFSLIQNCACDPACTGLNLNFWDAENSCVFSTWSIPFNSFPLLVVTNWIDPYPSVSTSNFPLSTGLFSFMCTINIQGIHNVHTPLTHSNVHVWFNPPRSTQSLAGLLFHTVTHPIFHYDLLHSIVISFRFCSHRPPWPWIAQGGFPPSVKLSNLMLDYWIWRAVFLVHILHALVNLMWHSSRNKKFNDSLLLQSGIFMP